MVKTPILLKNAVVILYNKMQAVIYLEIKEFSHFISLGCFCGVAEELERLGLRDSSYPFDWLIGPYSSYVQLISNNFENFLDENVMYQWNSDQKRYDNVKYNISFFHDFSKYDSFYSQIGDVQEKYARRIERFYRNIKQPTLFIRYTNNPEEAEFFKNHIEEQRKFFKKFCGENELIVVANSDVDAGESEWVFYVDPDEDDTVARKFVLKNKELEKILADEKIYNREKRAANLEYYNVKEKNKNSFNAWLDNKTDKYLGKLRKKYFHKNQIDKKV